MKSTVRRSSAYVFSCILRPPPFQRVVFERVVEWIFIAITSGTDTGGAWGAMAPPNSVRAILSENLRFCRKFFGNVDKNKNTCNVLYYDIERFYISLTPAVKFLDITWTLQALRNLSNLNYSVTQHTVIVRQCLLFCYQGFQFLI